MECRRENKWGIARALSMRGLLLLFLLFALPARPAKASWFCPFASLFRSTPAEFDLLHSGLSPDELHRVLRGGKKGNIERGNVDDYRQSVRNAVAAVLRVQGTPAELGQKRAALMFDLFTRLHKESGGDWKFIPTVLGDGSFGFVPPALPWGYIVRRSDGELFKGILSDKPDFQDRDLEHVVVPPANPPPA
jgi:hypothetical protein